MDATAVHAGDEVRQPEQTILLPGHRDALPAAFRNIGLGATVFPSA